MVLIKWAKFDGQQSTVDEVADRIFSMASNEALASTSLDIYRRLSITYNERAYRGAKAGLQVGNIAHGQQIKQWCQFLAQVKNKVGSIKFLVQEWKSDKYIKMTWPP